MSVIDRGILDEQYDLASGWLNATYLYKNFSLSAQTLNTEQVLAGLEVATSYNPEMLTLTATLRDNPELADRFRDQMIAEGRGLLQDLDALIEADGTLTADDVISFMDGVSVDLGQNAFSAHVNSSVDTPAEFFTFVTTDEYWTSIFTEEAQVENSMSALRVFENDPEFQQNLFDAAQQPGFFQYLQTLQDATGGADSTFLEDFLATPEGQASFRTAVATMASPEFDGNFAAVGNPILAQAAVTGMSELRESLRGMEPAERFTALRGNLVENGGSPELISAINDLDPSIQEALGNAFAYNDQFAAYVIEKMTPAEGADAEASADFATLLQNIRPEHAEYISNILNTIAQDPSYDVEESLDPLVEAVAEHTDLTQQLADARAADASEAEIAELQRQITEANRAMIRAVSEAGGNVPALAAMDGATMMAFMSDLVTGSGVEGAITNLGNNLGMDAEQIAALQELIGPFAGIIQFMVEPYAELYQEHGAAISGFVQEQGELIETVMGGGSVEFTDEAAAAARSGASITPASFEAPADTGNVVDFGEAFAAAMNGETFTDVDAVLEAMVEVDPELADEVAAIRTDADLMGQFTTWSGMMTSEEVAAASARELYANFNTGETLRTAVNNTLGM